MSTNNSAVHSAPLDANTVANIFLRLAAKEGKSLTPMQLLKLVYLAHGWTLGITKSPLISNPVEAWMYGPVIRKLYDSVCKYKGNPITQTLSSSPADIPSKKQREIIERTYETYKKMNGLQLSTLTHQQGTPWDQIFHSKGDFSVIPNDLIRSHYKNKLSNSSS